MGILDILFSNIKPSSEMTDKELKKRLDRSYGKNTGEDIATRASQIREAQRRGISTSPKKGK